MSLEHLTLTETHNFPIRNTHVHNGKVRSVYWLTQEDSQRLIEGRGYIIPKKSLLGIMIISDRISAFDVIWQAEQGLRGVPKKGAALNAISLYWFKKFEENELARNHILEVPHPLVWVVQRAQPIMIEAVARQYITGSMWRAYEKGERVFCGIELPDDLRMNQRLSELLVTPATKGTLMGIPGVPEEEDVNITRQQILRNYKLFGFMSLDDVFEYEQLLRDAFEVISKSEEIDRIGKIFVDTKLEFGYVLNLKGNWEMIFIDEAGTLDSSRMWDKDAYLKRGEVIERSKEILRQFLLRILDKDVLLNKKRMQERRKLAINYKVPVEQMLLVSDEYVRATEGITGSKIPNIENPRQEIIDALNTYGVIK